MPAPPTAAGQTSTAPVGTAAAKKKKKPHGPREPVREVTLAPAAIGTQFAHQVLHFFTRQRRPPTTNASLYF